MLRKLAIALALGIAAQAASAAPVSPKSQPKNAWGAIAYSSKTGAYGFAVDSV